MTKPAEPEKPSAPTRIVLVRHGVTAQTGANPARGENPWAGRLEYQMSKSWSLEAYAGTAVHAVGIRKTTDEESDATPSRVGVWTRSR